MQSTQKLTRVLRKLLELVEDEATRNPAFAARLETITTDLSAKQVKKTPTQSAATPPDVIATLQEKGEEEFRFWLRSLDVVTMKSIIKANGFDPAKVSARWTEPDKFVALIAEQSVARLKRGSAFLPPKAEPIL